MTSTDSKTVLGWLKAAGEDSRLRLLGLCAQQEMSVSDLAEALRQSEPRVSRHLRILCEAGLLERLRQGQWVHYRLTQEAAAAGFVRGVLGQIDKADRVGVVEQATGARTQESRLGRAIKGFVEAVDVAVGGDRSERPSAALVVGVEHLELLEVAASVAGTCVAIAHSRRAAQSARAFAERRGFACRVLLAASSNALCEKDIEAATERPARESPAGATERLARESPAGAGSAFEVVFLDHVAVPDSALEGMLSYGRRALAQGGRLWLFERYESLEVSREKVVEHPIGRLRRLLGEVGLTCERLSPIETDGEHVLAAVAVPSRGTGRGVGTAGAA
jgi:DNA-binding transcriptional ArsR family regulator